jgi:hypothetical protein
MVAQPALASPLVRASDPFSGGHVLNCVWCPCVDMNLVSSQHDGSLGGEVLYVFSFMCFGALFLGGGEGAGLN